jgi:hypothetical protein
MDKRYFHPVFSFLFVVLGYISTSAQKEITLEISHFLNGQPFAYEKKATNDLGFDIKITRLDYLLSNITLHHDDGKETFVDSSYFLVRNGEQFGVNLGKYDIEKLDSITFFLGVDSLNNHADPSLWPAGHALAPTWPDMHWGWQAGYRFVAIEGNNGPDFFYHFELHPLGDALLRKTTIITPGTQTESGIVVRLQAECSAIIAGINMSKVVFDHGSGKEAIGVMNNMQKKVFSPILGAATSVALPSILKAGPNPTNDGNVRISTDSWNTNGDILIVRNILGQVVIRKNVAGEFTDITLPTKGIYTAEIQSATGSLRSKTTLLFP